MGASAATGPVCPDARRKVLTVGRPSSARSNGSCMLGGSREGRVAGQRPRLRPSTSKIQKPRSEKMWCSKPGCNGECEGGYGFAGDYGLGSYSMCVKCSLVHDFFEDEG